MRSLKMNKVFAFLLIMCLLFSCSAFVYGADLNGVGNSNATETVETTSAPAETKTESDKGIDLGESTKSYEETKATADAVAGMFNRAGPDAEDIAKAEEFIAPFAKILNKVMAVILGITSLLMMFITVLDLLYMAFPPVRDMLDGGRMGAMQGQMGGMRGSRGMGGMRGGMGGYGMRGGMGGMGGYGMQSGMGGMGMQGGMGGMGGMSGMQGGMQGGMQQPQQIGGGLSAIGRWVSDEAIAACLESQGGIAEGQMGMQGSPVKPMLVSYIKKRSLFLILFGICVILFTSTVFTDLGVRIGTWILKMVSGFGS